MTGAIPALSHRLRLWLAAICLGASSVLMSAPAFARGPDGIADVAERVIDAVVNISTSQTVEAKAGAGGGGENRGAMPQLPPGSPFEEFFDDFFKNRRGGGPGGPGGQGGGPGGPGGPGGKQGGGDTPRRVSSLGSGFII